MLGRTLAVALNAVQRGRLELVDRRTLNALLDCGYTDASNSLTAKGLSCLEEVVELLPEEMRTLAYIAREGGCDVGASWRYARESGRVLRRQTVQCLFLLGLLEYVNDKRMRVTERGFQAMEERDVA